MLTAGTPLRLVTRRIPLLGRQTGRVPLYGLTWGHWVLPSPLLVSPSSRARDLAEAVLECAGSRVMGARIRSTEVVYLFIFFRLMGAWGRGKRRPLLISHNHAVHLRAGFYLQGVCPEELDIERLKKPFPEFFSYNLAVPRSIYKYLTKLKNITVFPNIVFYFLVIFKVR